MRLAILLLLSFAVAVIPPGVAQAASDLEVVFVDGEYESADETPEGFVLSAAYPNPFNPTTSFSLTIEERQEVTVEIFNVLGISVKHLFSGTMDADETRTFTFEADDLPSGIYLYRVTGESFTATRQMTLMK